MHRATCFLSILLVNILALILLVPSSQAEISNRNQLIINAHPRIFITNANKENLKSKAEGEFGTLYKWMIRSVNFNRPFKVFVRLNDLRDNIYKCGYLYQMTGDEKWADLVTRMMDQFPESIKAYGGANNGYAFALEGVSIGYDWCYDYINKKGRKKNTCR